MLSRPRLAGRVHRAVGRTMPEGAGGSQVGLRRGSRSTPDHRPPTSRCNGRRRALHFAGSPGHVCHPRSVLARGAVFGLPIGRSHVLPALPPASAALPSRTVVSWKGGRQSHSTIYNGAVGRFPQGWAAGRRMVAGEAGEQDIDRLRGRCSAGVRESTPVAVTYNTDDIRFDNGPEAADGRSGARCRVVS